VLFGLTLSDYLSRGWHTAPGGATTGAGTRVTIGPPQEPLAEGGSPAAPGVEH
jgi:hypothetical protein